MYSYKIGISAEEHDHFVKNSDQVNLLQSSNWAKIKDNWNNERIGFYKDDRLVATASILIRTLPLGLTMLYIPRGPIMNYSNIELVTFVIDLLKKLQKQNVHFLLNLTHPLFSNLTSLVRMLKKILIH